jgi:hypothetical protein
MDSTSFHALLKPIRRDLNDTKQRSEKPLYTQPQLILILLKAAVSKENMQSANTLAPEYNQNIHNILHGPDTCLLSFMATFRHSCILSQGSSVIIVTEQHGGQLNDHPTP